MKLRAFRIENFKGIRFAEIRFSENDNARVHTLVGLNESGKTTLLEALHSFSPDAEAELVVQNASKIEEQKDQWIPRDKISFFTGEIRITAIVDAAERHWSEFENDFKEETGLELRGNSWPRTFEFALVHRYEKGTYLGSAFESNLSEFEVKTKRATIWKKSTDKQRESLHRCIRYLLPSIAYYPTFVFDFPERIYLTQRSRSAKNVFYSRLFQDILDYDGQGFTIDDHIVERLHREDFKGLWESWFPAFVGSTEEDKAKQVISRAEQAVTEVVFSKWNEVFGEKASGKSVSIELAYEKGKLRKRDDGQEIEPVKHQAYIRFRIKDGSSIFSVDDRSLGFRWFFSFLLFTQFRLYRNEQRPTIFLFDEPASNLHAAAQQKLLESFPSIARDPHRLIYSTHSHYMVEPKWLEQACIVFDASASPDDEILSEGFRADEKVDVQAVPYRVFAQSRPNDTSYFQPILDTLEVRPSRFDVNQGGLIVEGKSDYYLLKLAQFFSDNELPAIFPGKGSGTLGALVSLHRGWGLPVRILLDSDRGGRDGRRKLKKGFAVDDREILSLSDISTKFRRAEDFVSKADYKRLTGNSKGTAKSALVRSIQEIVASGEAPELYKETKENLGRLALAVIRFCSEEINGQ